MPCTPIDLGNGVTAIVCTRGQRTKPCTVCGGTGGYACDWKLKGKKAGATCSRALCMRHAKAGKVHRPGPEKHAELNLCPAHLEAWKKHPANPANRPATAESAEPSTSSGL